MGQLIFEQIAGAARFAVMAGIAALVHFAPVPLHAETTETITLSWDEEIPADDDNMMDEQEGDVQRLAISSDSARPSAKPIASFGPFHLVDKTTVEMIGAVDDRTPAAFQALLTRFPGVRTLRLIECPGTEDDAANFRLAEMVRKAGLATHVPAHGSIRSGGVELFLAGVSRRADAGAELGVHSWQDSDGLQAKDVPAGDPAHRRYLDFYERMGMSPQAAKAFYDFTNQAPADGIYYMTEADMLRFGLIG
jgi:hypothetical protein